LLRIDVVDYRRAPSSAPGINSTNKTTFADGSTGYHKPFLGADPGLAASYAQEAVSQSINECAAWRLARHLGHPYDAIIPVTVFRWIEADAAARTLEPGIKEGWGALSHTRNGRHYAADPWADADLVDRAAFLDSLMANQDRHPGQYRWDASARQLSLLDHGFAFPAQTGTFNQSAFLDRRHQEGRAGLSPEELELTRMVRNDAQMAGLRLLLSPEQIDVTEQRLDRMIARAQVIPTGGR
jgi:hypothetical protein